MLLVGLHVSLKMAASQIHVEQGEGVRYSRNIVEPHILEKSFWTPRGRFYQVVLSTIVEALVSYRLLCQRQTRSGPYSAAGIRHYNRESRLHKMRHQHTCSSIRPDTLGFQVA